MDSTNHRPKILEKKYYIVADIYYVVKPTMVMSVVNAYRLFFLALFPKQ